MLSLFSIFRRLFSAPSASGVLLLAAAGLAILHANSPWAASYYQFLHFPLSLNAGLQMLPNTLLDWVNEGLMAIFFLLVSMEIKRELLEGELSPPRQALLPALAALGGIILPALIYLYINAGNAAATRGWAIPSATDIAFSLALLAVLGRRVPISLKVFLTAIAVLDDLAAILIIALYYNEGISISAVSASLVCIAVLGLFQWWRVRPLWPYLMVGLALWIMVMQSGIHATVAGVALGFAIPLRTTEGPSPLRYLESRLNPWVAYLILPIFSFANAGLSLQEFTPASFFTPMPLGIALGLILGKPLGIFLATWLSVKAGFAAKPRNATWLQVFAVGMVAGIGFTMSLFIGSLAFITEDQHNYIRLGVLGGSLISAVAGYAMLRLGYKTNRRKGYERAL